MKTRLLRNHLSFAAGVALGFLAGRATAAPAPTETALAAFERREVMIPMRDGVRLFTLVLTQKTAPESLPLLLVRTPYGTGTNGFGGTKAFEIVYKELQEDGYVFVFQKKKAIQTLNQRPQRGRRK